MKTLTICQPYAELIMLGQKLCENRTWGTNYRGWIGIHAGKSRAWLKTFPPGMTPRKMEFGMLIGMAKLVDCMPIAKVRKDRKLFEKLSPHAEGPVCWMLEDVCRFNEPVELAGKQGLFDADDSLFERLWDVAGQRCHVCGCTENNACPEGCSWVNYDTCSSCADESQWDKCHPLLG
jgi:hypothetical protein